MLYIGSRFSFRTVQSTSSPELLALALFLDFSIFYEFARCFINIKNLKIVKKEEALGTRLQYNHTKLCPDCLLLRDYLVL